MPRAPVLLALALLAGCLAPQPVPPAPEAGGTVTWPAAVVTTDAGTFTMILYEDVAPKTVRNFRDLAEASFYEGVIFHRVIDGFVVQTGDKTGTGSGPYPLATVPSEPGYHFAAGTVGMARDEDPDSATSQWFVDEYPQPHLHDGVRFPPFAAWAQVVEGMDVVKAIAAAETFATRAQDTAPVPLPPQVPPGTVPDRPVEDIRIVSVEFVDLEMDADVAARYPLKTTGRFVTDTMRTTLELWNSTASGREVTLTWYTTPRTRDVAPVTGATVEARGPDGAVATLPTTADPLDPFILRTTTTFPTTGTWNLTLRSGAGTWAMFDVDVGAP